MPPAGSSGPPTVGAVDPLRRDVRELAAVHVERGEAQRRQHAHLGVVGDRQHLVERPVGRDRDVRDRERWRRAGAASHGSSLGNAAPRSARGFSRRTVNSPTLDGMPVESLFPRLEPLLPSVGKPIQYVGGELNATVKDWDSADGALGADVPRRVRGRPAQPGRADPLRGAQRARLDPGRAHVRGVPRHGEGHARARHPAVHRRRAPPGRARSTCSASRSRPSSATPTC